MSYNFRVLQRAQREIKESSAWYEEQQPNLGSKFESAVLARIRTISNNPLHYPLKGKLREAIVRDFPFLILYRMDDSHRTIVVMSVFHMSRHPNKK
ncbi:type II toxin-antitoxin system RelE/ParE family toxin [Mucilaginibacter psychrotolerans]|uniref:Type II toxin-antitoxin system RelE/ParE family toxin n=1 Tax=Mucilaginibacter psychrotolerans TaxID=1524096 RepID=A0A4Y8S8T5_9SPHI|nr:type II toxin-antitoxin system RelE/ParE family toxin [Mucilaginibacter psychrotolerans]